MITEINCFNIKPGYFISEYGNIYSTNKIKGEFIELKQDVDKDGYYRISLVCNDSKRRSFRINRLVASVFISNPLNLPIVLHLDNNKMNNHYSNLKWGTIQENTQQAYDDGCCSCNIPVQLVNKTTGVVDYEFNSISDLCRYFNYSIGNVSTIAMICANERPQYSRGKFEKYYIRYKPILIFRRV